MATIAKASQQLLLDAINRDNGLTENPITLAQMGMGLPIPTGVSNAFYNTYVTVFGIYGQGYNGSVQLSYQRYVLETMFLGLTPILIANPSPTKHSDLLPLLNAQYGLALDATDIVDQAIPAGTESAIINLTMASTSWAWLGTIPVRFAKTLPYITDVATITALNTINPAYPIGTKPQAEYVAYGYDWTDAYATLTDTNATVGKILTQSQFDALTTITTLKLTMATGGAITAGQISLANAVWGGTVLTSTDSKYNQNFKYVNTLTMDANSNYTGNLILQFDQPSVTT